MKTKESIINSYNHISHQNSLLAKSSVEDTQNTADREINSFAKNMKEQIKTIFKTPNIIQKANRRFKEYDQTLNEEKFIVLYREALENGRIKRYENRDVDIKYLSLTYPNIKASENITREDAFINFLFYPEKEFLNKSIIDKISIKSMTDLILHTKGMGNRLLKKQFAGKTLSEVYADPGVIEALNASYGKNIKSDEYLKVLIDAVFFESLDVFPKVKKILTEEVLFELQDLGYESGKRLKKGFIGKNMNFYFNDKLLVKKLNSAYKLNQDPEYIKLILMSHMYNLNKSETSALLK